ncbi:lutropin-choriogonadotropic hormone receptor-like [Ptychodera flava]|uniref:lutropin-choriogonadotropic hormone receptor-like n=1 Tax=Ptychodera flava TaxID=63121 RepID=UPI00396A33B6
MTMITTKKLSATTALLLLSVLSVATAAAVVDEATEAGTTHTVTQGPAEPAAAAGDQVTQSNPCANISEHCKCIFGDRLTVKCYGVPTFDLSVLSIPLTTRILDVKNAQDKILKSGSFSGLDQLEYLTLSDWPNLKSIEAGALDGLPRLTYLEIFRMRRLSTIGPGVLADFPDLKNLRIHGCGLTSVPDFSNFSTSEISVDIQLDRNHISVIHSDDFFGVQVVVAELSLVYNDIAVVQDFAFRGLTVVEIDLSDNPLTELETDAFAAIKELRTLKLSNSEMTYLPTNGLNNIIELHITKTYSFKTFPPVFNFERIRTARLTYFTHCCAFSFPTEENYHNAAKFEIFEGPQNTTTCPPTVLPNSTMPYSFNKESLFFTDLLPMTRKRRRARRKRSEGEEWGDHPVETCDDPFCEESHTPNFEDVLVANPTPHGPIPTKSSNGDVWISEIVNPNRCHNHIGDKSGALVPKDYALVDCQPEPNPFNPCGDVLSYVFLKILIWFVALTAVLGNFVVLVVLLSYISKMTVTKFLMCNLAFADFSQGVYLLVTGIVDMFTAGQYYNYAIDWQWGAGCRAIGFISIFATMIGVFTLTVITMERWYAIIHAMHLNKRLHMKMAAKIMIGGWSFALFMAALPLFGISDYSVTSMCLPMQANNPVDLAYVLMLCSVITLAFLLVVGCYIKMYLTVRSPESCSLAHKKDATVAKRMGILVFTDFACVVPIMFFAFSAALGKPFIGVEEAKILLVIFYPINSCANPFLYALCTKAFRRDLFMILTKHGFCEKRAMKYKGTYSSGARSMSHSVNHPPITTSTSHRPSTGSVLTQCMVDWHYNGNEWHNSRSSLNSNITPQTTPQSVPRNFHTVQSQEEEEDSTLLNNAVLMRASGSVSSSGSSKSKESLSKKLSTVLERQDPTSTVEAPTETTKLNPSEVIWRRQDELDDPTAPIANEEHAAIHNDYENIETIEAMVAESGHSSDTNSDQGDMTKSYRLPLDKFNQARKDSRTDSGIHSAITTPDVLENIDKQFPNREAGPQTLLLEAISDETRV